MFASIQRDDGAYVKINTQHIVYTYPANGKPDDPTVVVLSTGDNLKVKDSHIDFWNKLDDEAMRP